MSVLLLIYGRYVATAIDFRMMSLEVFLLFLSFTCYSSALYFHIGETEKKCFIEDIPDETMVVGEVVERVYCMQLVGYTSSHYMVIEYWQ